VRMRLGKGASHSPFAQAPAYNASWLLWRCPVSVELRFDMSCYKSIRWPAWRTEEADSARMDAGAGVRVGHDIHRGNGANGAPDVLRQSPPGLWVAARVDGDTPVADVFAA